VFKAFRTVFSPHSVKEQHSPIYASFQGVLNVTTTDELFTQELDDLIAQCKIRIEQQRIHAKELSGDPPQQRHARAELVAALAGLAKLQGLKKHFTKAAHQATSSSA
jgi:hypothetical protein